MQEGRGDGGWRGRSVEACFTTGTPFISSHLDNNDELLDHHPPTPIPPPEKNISQLVFIKGFTELLHARNVFLEALRTSMKMSMNFLMKF